MGPVELIAAARAAGLTLQPDGDRLTVRGPRSAALPLLDTLREHKPAILALLANEAAEMAAREAAEAAAFERAVAWRVAVLRPHVPAHGPIILPPVRENVPALVSKDEGTGAYVHGTHCGSCGEPRESGQQYHCRACQRARYIVLNEIREDVPFPPLPAPEQQQQQQQQQQREPAA